MDKFAKRLRQANDLRSDIVSDILEVLNEKGYSVGSTVRSIECTFKIESDRLLIKPHDDDSYWHTDFLEIFQLIGFLREALHIIPKR